MVDSPIQQISDTAFWVAAYRALESARRDALFRDPLAARLAGDRGREIARSIGHKSVMAWSVAIRTAIVDELIRSALAEGTDTVLNLGAGLDTRPYRMELPSTLRWVEVDFPHMIAFKSERLAGESPRCRLDRIGLDLADREALRTLLRDIDAQASRALVITEGVVPYLAEEDVGDLADDLASMPHVVRWVLDYFSAMFMDYYRKGRFRLNLGPNVSFRFAPEDWEGFFRAHGWNLEAMRYHQAESRRLRRHVPRTFIFLLLRPFLPRRLVEQVEHMTGFALLGRDGAG